MIQKNKNIMKNLFFTINILCYCFFFTNCKEKVETIDCSQFKGSPIEGLLVDNGAGGLASDLNTYLNSAGGMTRLHYSNIEGSNKGLLTGAHVEIDQLTQIRASGSIKFDSFAVTIHENIENKVVNRLNNRNGASDNLAFFDGGQHTFTQTALDGGIPIHQFNFKIPKAFFSITESSSIAMTDGAVIFNWPADLSNQNGVYIVLYATQGMGNPDIPETLPFYLVKKVQDNGIYTITAEEITSLPINSRFYAYAIRSEHILYDDSRDVSKKKLSWIMSSTQTTLKKS